MTSDDLRLPLSLARAARYDLLAIGENSIDLVAEVDGFPETGSKHELRGLTERHGGEAASASVGLARLGGRVAYLGRVGGDQGGIDSLERWAHEGVDVSSVVVVPEVATRMALILVDRLNGQRTVIWQRDPKLALTADDLNAVLMGAARVMLVGSDDVLVMAEAASQGRAAGVKTVGDLERVHPGTDRLLRQLDLLVMSATFPTAFSGRGDLGAALAEVAAFSGAAMACVTLGEEGCLALVGSREVRAPAVPVEVVDTTGAGDLFRSGLIARWLQEPDRPRVAPLLEYANAVAALNCTARGAWAGAPRRADVEALLLQPLTAGRV